MALGTLVAGLATGPMILLVLGQVDTNPDTPESVLAAVIFLGTVMVGGMLAALRAFWKDLKDTREENARLRSEHAAFQRELLERSLQVAMDSTARLSEAGEVLDRAMNILSDYLPNSDITEIKYHLRALRERSP